MANGTVNSVGNGRGRGDGCDYCGGGSCPVKTTKNTWSPMLMYSIRHSFMRHLFYACFLCVFHCYCSDVYAVYLYIKSGVSFNIYHFGLWSFYTSDYLPPIVANLNIYAWLRHIYLLTSNSIIWSQSTVPKRCFYFSFVNFLLIKNSDRHT